MGQVRQMQDPEHKCMLNEPANAQDRAAHEECRKFKQCISCPVRHATCTHEGQLVCDAGFVEEDHQCVENQVVREHAMAILRNFETTLREQRGSYECGEDTPPTIQGRQFRAMLTDGGRRLYGEGSQDAIDALLAKVTELLNTGKPSFDVHWRLGSSP